MKSQSAPERETNPSEIQKHTSVNPAAKPLGQRTLSGTWLWLVVVAVIGAGVWYFSTRGTLAASSTSKGGSREGKRGSGVVPVVAAKARRGDIGVYITGLGSVTPLYTVTLKSRVDGQLMAIHYSEGNLVHEGDLLLEIDPRPYQVQLEVAEGQMVRDQANLANARIDLDRYQKLLAQDAIPEQQLATQKALVTQDEGIVKSDQGQIDNAKLSLAYCKIAAPITGKVGLRLVDPGNIVHAADTNGLLVITQTDPISVIFTVAEDDLQVVLRKLAAGEHLRAEAWDRDDQIKIGSGTLATVDNQIDPTTGSLRLRANFENKSNLLFPNQFVNVRLLLQQKSGVTLVPTAVLQRNTNSTYVYLVKPNKTVTVRQVEVGTTEGNDTEITSGVNPGDVLVMTGVDKLDEGTRVSVELPNDQAEPGAAEKSKPGGKKK
jgi:multidrug efflux system membrane fusion protein